MFDKLRLGMAVNKFTNHGLDLARENSRIKGRKNWLYKDISHGHVGAYDEFKYKVERQIEIVNEALQFIDKSTSGKKQNDISKILDRLAVELKDLKAILVRQHMLVKEHAPANALWDQLRKESDAISKVLEEILRGQKIADNYLGHIDKRVADEIGIAALQYMVFFMIALMISDNPQPNLDENVKRLAIDAGVATAVTKVLAYFMRKHLLVRT